ncbi:MAG: nucleoside 2-deoxyribosyltransferase [Oscillospiraceae bacterium]|nr:nucleoside 2-deoxyribosyltransferase [Oscillospiraceae bacterium]
MKKIYFCGSIRGGRDDVFLYQRIIKRMKDLGNTVLTEHIASPEVFGLEKDKSDHDIWVEDMSWLKESDIVVAECSTASLGVGYELAVAKTLGKHTYVFARKKERSSSLSAMIAGDPYYHVVIYGSEEELFSCLDTVINESED